ncbi:MAG: Coenzyme F420 hydrogenase/dehydrogenase, beta subunit C-terminal domain, partial [Desulfitobacterium hafniense]|nr:Coenzyme F420 hydrogenase/dehydrogenase, beta subunit C-terminal domain [Desulfitobacterium hafniense]
MEQLQNTKLIFGFERLQERVIERGLCTACGTCVGVCPAKAITIRRYDGEPLPFLDGKCSECGNCEAVCPGEEINLYELELGIFGRIRTWGTPRNPEELHLGIFKDTYRGWALNQKIRQNGSGGGVVTGILAWALESGLVDGVIVAGFNPQKAWQTQPFLARSPEDVYLYAQSKYAVVTMNSLLQEAIESGCERLGIVGLPCQVHALRKLKGLGRPKRVAERLKLVIGLFCASQFYFEGTRHLLVEQGNTKDLN